jgi:uncharacterized RDD family membrane protein YckC
LGAWLAGVTGPQTYVLIIGWVCTYALLSRFQPQRQYLHDVLAGTRLINAD